MQENNTAQVTPEVQSVAISNDQQPKNNNFLLILLSILLFISVAISGFFAFQTQKLVKELTLLRTVPTSMAKVEPTTEPVATNSANVTTNSTVNWKTYVDPQQRFSIKYPSTWRIISGDFFGTGPREIGEDILWGVNTYDINTNSIAKVADEQGKQFSDRKQTSNKIKVGSLNATQIITTTATVNDWYLETIIFEDADTLFVVSNGAIKDSNLQKMVGVPEGTTFKDFYMSFKMIN